MRRGSPLRRIATVIGALVVLFFVVVLIDSALYYHKVHAGVSIDGYSVGGLTQAGATAKLQTLVDHAAKNQIVLTSGSKRWPLMPDQLGTKIDVAASVKTAMDESRNRSFFSDVVHRFSLFFNHKDLPILGAVDGSKMDSTIANVAKELDVLAVNAALAIDGDKIAVVDAKKGRVIDRDALKQKLTALLLTLHSTEVPVPMKDQLPAITAESSVEAIAQAKTMIGSPITVRYQGKNWTLSSSDIGEFMDFSTKQDGGTSVLVPLFSSAKLKAFFDEISPAVNVKGKDATWATDGETATVVPGTMGIKVDADKTADAITKAALSKDNRLVDVVVTEAEPDRTTAEAQAMGIVEKISAFSTQYVGDPDRQVNVRLTTKYATEVIVAPGEEYNFDKTIGPRTPERGYRKAPGIVTGIKLEDVFGGGICQVSTTMFNAVFFAGLKVTERVNHSIFITHYPLGRDATATADGPNLRWVNDTDHYILVRGSSDGIHTTIVLYGTNPHRKVTYTTSGFYNIKSRTTQTFEDPAYPAGTTFVADGGQDGRQLKVVRTVLNPDGSVLHTDSFVSTWPMQPRIVTVGKGTSSSSTTGTTKPGSSTSTTKKPPSTTTTKKKPSPTTT
jgi:vancomycin resistance protein YoaR